MGGIFAIRLVVLGKHLVADPVLIDPAIPLRPGALLELTVAVGFGNYLTSRLGLWFLAARNKKLPIEVMMCEVLELVVFDLDRISPTLVEERIEMAKQRRMEVRDSDVQFSVIAKSML